MQTATQGQSTSKPPAASASGELRRGGRRKNDIPKIPTQIIMPEAPPVSPEDLVRDAIDIFVTKRDGAIGEAAFRYDKDGLYDKATGTAEYYMREGDVGLHERYARACANRINGVETVVVVGQGPGHIFESKEGNILSKLPRLKRVITIDIATENNIEAARYVKGKLSAIFGREIEHIGLCSDFRKAVAAHPELFKPSERRAVLCSGSTIMNLPPSILDQFPAADLGNDLQLFADMAGDNGHVLVTYDSNENEKKILAPYVTKEAKDLFFNVIDVQGEYNPHLKGLSRSHFRYAVDFNPAAHEVRQRLIVAKPYNFSLPFAANGNIRGVHAVSLHVGDAFHMISSYKPEIDRMAEVVASTQRLTTELVTREEHGPTIQLMRVRPRLLAA